MIRLIAILSILAALSITGMADKDAPGFTCGESNGLYWTHISEEAKTAYIIGYMEGHPTFTGSVAPLNGITYRALAVEVDTFFSNHSTLLKISDAIFATGLRIGTGSIENSELYVKTATEVAKACDAVSKSAK